MTFYVGPAMHQQFRIHRVNSGESIQALTNEALNALSEKYGIPLIA